MHPIGRRVTPAKANVVGEKLPVNARWLPTTQVCAVALRSAEPGSSRTLFWIAYLCSRSAAPDLLAHAIASPVDSASGEGQRKS